MSTSPHNGSDPHVDDPQWHLAERFVVGDMSAEEHERFAAAMAADPALSELVDEVRESVLAVRAGAMRQHLDRIHQKQVAPPKNRRSVWLALAAGIVLLIAAGIWWMARPDFNERLFAEYATTDPGLPVPMSTTDQYAFYDAMVDYKSEAYQMAIDKWEPLLAANPSNDTLTYYIGAAYFNLGQYPRAIEYYDDIDARSTFHSRSRWYLALSYLQTGDKEALMNIQPDEKSPYAEKIDALKRRMD